MGEPRIRLLIVDVDGTLLTPDKTLTARAQAAIEELRRADVEVALTSGRPPRGLSMLVERLAIRTPLAAFNGGMFVRPDMELIEEHSLSREAATRAADLIRDHGLTVWVYRGTDWYVPDLEGAHVDREQRTVQFAPECLRDLDEVLDRAVKITGVSDDLEAVKRCEAEARELQREFSASRSQPYYLDFTHRDANKGTVVQYLSRSLDLTEDEIATIGDMPNDVDMFVRSGLSIAMGNASSEVQRRAHHVTAANTAEGFARGLRAHLAPLWALTRADGSRLVARSARLGSPEGRHDRTPSGRRDGEATDRSRARSVSSIAARFDASLDPPALHADDIHFETGGGGTLRV